MKNINIFAQPGRTIVIQIVNENNDVEKDVKTWHNSVHTVVSDMIKENDISNIYVIGKTAYADKIESIARETAASTNTKFTKSNVERIKDYA